MELDQIYIGRMKMYVNQPKHRKENRHRGCANLARVQSNQEMDVGEREANWHRSVRRQGVSYANVASQKKDEQ